MTCGKNIAVKNLSGNNIPGKIFLERTSSGIGKNIPILHSGKYPRKYIHGYWKKYP
jgi:hypothetical protein